MAFNGSGVFNLTTGNPVVTGTTISSTWANNTLNDVATGLSNCVTRDGQSPATANLPMGGYKLTGLALATATGDALSYGRAATVTDFTYTGTLTGGTGILNIGSGQVYKDASGNMGIGTSGTSGRLTLASTSTDTTNYYNGTRLSLQNLSATNGNFTEMSFMSANGNDYAAIWGVCASHTLNATTGAIVFGTTNAASVASERMRIDSSGNLLVGTTSNISNSKINSVFDQASASGIGLKNTSATATGYFCAFYNSAGSLQGSITQTSSTVTAYNVASDARLKIDKGIATNASVIDNTIVHDFEWVADGVSDRGVFAQEAYLVKPSAVTKGNDDLNKDGNIVHPWAVDYSKYVPDSIVYCQQLKKHASEQQTLIEALTERLTKAGL